MSNRSVKGVVKDASSGEPLFMAKVVAVDGSGKIVTDTLGYTNDKGEFDISVPEDYDTIEVRFVGFHTVRPRITNSRINVGLKSKTLDTVVVTPKDKPKSPDNEKRNWWIIGGITLAGIALLGSIVYIVKK